MIPKLILFDIDQTLIRTHGAGRRALLTAGRSLFGSAFTDEGIEYSGRIDPLIIREMFELSGVPHTPDRVTEMRRAYGRELATALSEPGPTRRPLPGVGGLIDALERRAEVTLGLLTGNFAETGRMKLSACGVDPGRFRISVWGDESPHDPPSRDHLPPVGMRRYRETHGRPIEPHSVTIIGDSPSDVRCAAASGCRSLGVATGQFSVQQLQAAGAHGAVADLVDTDAVVSWLLD